MENHFANYYSRQLDKLKNSPTIGTSVKITGVNGETNYLGLNEESIPAIIEFLQTRLADLNGE